MRFRQKEVIIDALEYKPFTPVWGMQETIEAKVNEAGSVEQQVIISKLYKTGEYIKSGQWIVKDSKGNLYGITKEELLKQFEPIGE